MKCIAVYPILKTTFSEMLTYWTTFDYKTGDLIQIPLQNRKVWAIVDSILSISEAKEFIKSQSFTIRKITEKVESDFFSHQFILSCLDASRYYVCSFGEVMAEVVPKHVLSELSDGKKKIAIKNIQKNTQKNKPLPVEYLQDTFGNRIVYIKKLLHQRKDRLTCIVAPTREKATELFNKLESGDFEVCLLHGSVSAKKAKVLPTSGVVIITPIYLYLLDYLEIDLCIMESAGEEYYRHLLKSVDFRYIIREFAKRKNIQLIESDTLLPLYKHSIIKEQNVSFVLPKDPDMHIIDQILSAKAKVKDLKVSKKSRPVDMADVKEIVGLRTEIVTHKKLDLITPELFSLIKYCEKEKKSLLIYTVRKGLSSQIVCKDCQQLFCCDQCQKSYSIKEINGQKLYVCPMGHDPKPIHSRCPTCQGMHLRLIGAGTEAIAKELKDTTTLPIEIIDGDRTTPAKAKKLLHLYKEKKMPLICIGTELLLNQTHEISFEYSAIVSLETLLALPSQFAELAAARVINTLIERTEKSIVIQTRNPTHVIWGCITKKNWLPLYQGALRDAESLNLPPFSVHVQVCIRTRYEQKKANRKTDAESVYDYIEQFGYVATDRASDKVTHHLFLKHDSWPDQALQSYLKSLPQYIQVQVDVHELL